MAKAGAAQELPFGPLKNFCAFPHSTGVRRPGPAPLFTDAESDYTRSMRVGVAIITWLSLLTPGILSAAEQSPLELYGALNALRVDSAAVYQIPPANRIELRRGDLQLSFDEGNLAFFASLNGRTTGAVFSGHGHALALPRDPVEKQQMARFLGAPVLDQDFTSAYLRFTDDSASDLLRQFKNANVAPQQDAAYAARWEPHLARLNPQYSLR